MMRTLFLTALGYLSGSLLFARYFGKLCCRRDIVSESADKNPGTFNAFRYGGFVCGTLTLCFDLLKGFLPVFLYRTGRGPAADLGLALVLAAPVYGHILPLYHKFRGGKGIAVSFGCLLGLLPEARPLLIFACTFLILSLVVKITPNYHRTFFAYLLSVVGMILLVPNAAISIGFSLTAILVCAKFLCGSERKESVRVDVAWKH